VKLAINPKKSKNKKITEKSFARLKELTKHLTTRADDSRATPVQIQSNTQLLLCILMSRIGKVLRGLSH
jgi:hypothetical protein